LFISWIIKCLIIIDPRCKHEDWKREQSKGLKLQFTKVTTKSPTVII